MRAIGFILSSPRFQAAVSHVDRGRILHQSGDLQGASNEFSRAIAIDGGNQTAQQELDQVRMELAVQATANPSTPSRQVSENANLLSIASPIQLSPASNDPVTLHAVEDIKNIYQAIGKLAGLNVIFDPDYASKRIPVDLVNVSLADALRIVGTISGTFYKPVTSNTIFVAQNNPTKRRDLDNLAVQTFYLANASQQADANEVLTALRNLLDTNSKVTLIPSRNAIVVRSTPDQLLLAQKLISDVDGVRPEVTVDVAILQVNRDKMRKLGIVLPQSITITPQTSQSTSSNSSSSSNGSSGATTPNNFTLNTLGNMNATNFGVSLSGGTLNALFTDEDTRILQNPRIRATDGQKASLKIGSKIPIATGSYNAGVATGVASIGVQTQFTYVDVGVNIDITPMVHYDGEVTLKAHMEVSSTHRNVTISGVEEPIIDQNVVEQVIQLKEGEPSLLAGLVNKKEDRQLNGTPGLGELPLLKSLFSSNLRATEENEIIFVLVPHVVRESVLTRLNRRVIDTGTGASFELRQDPTLLGQDEVIGLARPNPKGQATSAANAATAAAQQMLEETKPLTSPLSTTEPSHETNR